MLRIEAIQWFAEDHMHRFTIALAHIQIVYFMAAEQPDIGMFRAQHDIGESPAERTQVGDDNHIAP